MQFIASYEEMAMGDRCNRDMHRSHGLFQGSNKLVSVGRQAEGWQSRGKEINKTCCWGISLRAMSSDLCMALPLLVLRS